jgi:general stress protein 26
MDFTEIFNCFVENKSSLKVISVASSDERGKPNSAAKMLVDVCEPNVILFLDYRFTQTFSNVKKNPQLSISFMSDASFTGYRLTGTCEVIDAGKEFEEAKKLWDKRVITYETDRIIERIRGHYSTKESENSLPADFIIMKFLAKEGAVIKPDRVFRADGS